MNDFFLFFITCIAIIIDNKLGTKGAQAVADALKSNTALTQLEISGMIAIIVHYSTIITC